MCGIIGFQGDYPKELLLSMIDYINHRGPDDCDIRYFGTHKSYLGLGHTRLSILDLSQAGHQPMTVNCTCCQDTEVHDSQKLWLTYNGELYNYRKLKADLVKKGHTFVSSTDTEVLLHLYAEYGIKMLEQLNGIFAFALYDGRPSSQKEGIQSGDLIIVRDGMGVKPLYYSQTKSGFLFSSELKALLCSDAVSRNFDFQGLDNYLTYLWSPGERTMLASVKKLLPGHGMLIRAGKIERIWEYYDIPINQEIKSNLTFDQAANQLREKLTVAINRQMVADVPVGAFLSGGLDSSSIVALMRQQHPNLPIDCFTIRTTSKNNDGFADDLPYAQKVAKHLNVNLHMVDINPHMISRLPEMIYHLDEPQGDPAALNILLIAELAHKQGIKVLMSGAGGDDLFTGYRRHLAINYDKYWQWLPFVVRSFLAKLAQDALYKGKCARISNLKFRRIAKLLKDIDKTGDARLASFFDWGNKNLRLDLYSRAVQNEISLANQENALENTLSQIKGGTPLSRMLYLELKHFLADHNLNYTDKAGMAKGVEIRVPLLDPDLVNFAFTLPDSFKQRGGISKAIFKKAMEPLLPKEIIYRPKTGFGAPLREWLRGELKDVVADILSDKSISARGLFNPRAVSDLIKLNGAGKADVSYIIFALLSVELWCRQFVDVKVPKIITF